MRGGSPKDFCKEGLWHRSAGLWGSGSCSSCGSCAYQAFDCCQKLWRNLFLLAGALPAPRSAIESTGHWAEARCKCKRCRSVHVKRLLILSRALWCKLAVLEHVDTSRSICRSRRWLCCAASPRHPAVFAFAQLVRKCILLPFCFLFDADFHGATARCVGIFEITSTCGCYNRVATLNQFWAKDSMQLFLDSRCHTKRRRSYTFIQLV